VHAAECGRLAQQIVATTSGDGTDCVEIHEVLLDEWKELKRPPLLRRPQTIEPVANATFVVRNSAPREMTGQHRSREAQPAFR
jgi:hypothetical protein